MKSERGFLVVSAALIGWAVGYALPIYARLPSLHYDPLAGRWFAGARPGPQAMGYYGQMAWGLVGAFVGAVAALLVARAGLRLTSSRLGLMAAWALTAIGLVGAWFTFSNWP